LQAKNNYENKKLLVCTCYLEGNTHNNLLQSKLQRPKAFDIVDNQAFTTQKIAN
jgi:hypothetical protein